MYIHASVFLCIMLFSILLQLTLNSLFLGLIIKYIQHLGVVWNYEEGLRT